MVVKNILSNALKYTRKCNTAVISVSMEYDKPFKRISVTDNGAGFDEGIQINFLMCFRDCTAVVSLRAAE